MNATQAVGLMLTDFEKRFIRTQTISYQNLIDSGSIVNAKTKELIRIEGKEYIVNKDDVMGFLFNVWLVVRLFKFKWSPLFTYNKL